MTKRLLPAALVLLAGLVLLPLAGCASSQAGYGGGAGGFFYGECLDDVYGCYDGRYPYSYYGYAFPGAPATPQRARVTKVDRKVSTRVVKRMPSSTAPSPRSVSSARSAPAPSSRSGASAGSRSAPSRGSHTGSRR